MDRNKLYDDDNAYIKIINWPEIYKIVSHFIVLPFAFPPVSGMFNVNDTDAKNPVSYSYTIDTNGKTPNNNSKTKRIVLRSSDGRSLSISYSFLITGFDLVLRFSLRDKEIIFLFDMNNGLKQNPSIENIIESKCIKIFYCDDKQSLDVTDGLLNSYNKLIGIDVEKAMNIYNLHHEIVDLLCNIAFDPEELKMFDEKIWPIIYRLHTDEQRMDEDIIRR